MIQVEQINEVRKFHLARSLIGRGFYFTTAYWVDGMMVDTGCAYTVQELVTWRAKFHVGRTQWNSFLFHREVKNPPLKEVALIYPQRGFAMPVISGSL